MSNNSLPENAFRPLKEGETYEPLMPAKANPREVTAWSLVLGLLIHLRKSLAASWILCLYSVASMLYYLFSAGTLTGVLPVVAAFIAMKQTTHLNALWQRFLKDGKLPK